MDGTVALMLVLVMLFVVAGGPLFGADSRRAWRNVRPEDWPPSEFKR